MGGTKVGWMIRAARKRLGLTLEDVAGQVGVTPGALSHIESGRRLPNPSNTLRIAEVLGIEPRELMDALDYEHSERRERSAYESRDASGAVRSRPPSRAYSERPIEELFAVPGGIGPDAFEDDDIAAVAPSGNMNMLRISPSRAPSPRDRARWSDDTPQRLQALEQLADTASDAIRTLRGLLEDDDPMVRKEARRLLRELDVRLPEE